MGFQIVQPSPLEQAAAVATAIAAILLFIEYKGEINEDIDRLEEYYNKMIDVATYYNDQYNNVIDPQLVAAIQGAISAPVFGVDYNIASTWQTRMARAGSAADRSEDMLMRSYRLQQRSDCDTHLSNDFKASGVDGAFIETQSGERREERMRATKWRAVQSLLPSATRGAAEVMNFIGNAIDLRSSSLAMASGGLNGALGSLSWALNRLSSGFKSRTNSAQSYGTDTYDADYGGTTN